MLVNLRLLIVNDNKFLNGTSLAAGSIPAGGYMLAAGDILTVGDILASDDKLVVDDGAIDNVYDYGTENNLHKQADLGRCLFDVVHL